jgi:hypothetical protein
VHQLEILRRAELGRLWKRSATLLAYQACITDLVDMVDLREAAHHACARHLLQSTKVLMPKALVPAPSIVAAASREANRLRNL